jgi:hypothetical protein
LCSAKGRPGQAATHRIPEAPRSHVIAELLEFAPVGRDYRICYPDPFAILIVISDGASVVDSTLSVNTDKYRERRLRLIIEDIEARSQFELIARRQSRQKHTEANGLGLLRGERFLHEKSRSP